LSLCHSTDLDVFDSLLASEPVPGDDGGGVDLLLDELKSELKTFIHLSKGSFCHHQIIL
jgi:hypothetical protein